MKNRQVFLKNRRFIGFLIGIILYSSVAFAATAINSTEPIFWHFDEGSEITTKDAAGKSLGTLTNGVRWGAGKFGTALVFDGNDDAVAIISQDTRIKSLQAFTFVGWIFPTKNGGIIFRKGAGPTAFFNIYTTQAGNPSNLPVGVFGFNAGYNIRTGSWQTVNNVSLNEWHQVAVTYSRGMVPKLYIDGVVQEIVESSKPSGTDVTDDFKAFIGNNHMLIQSSGVFGGKIDEIRLYDRILTSQEISALYKDESQYIPRPNIIVIMADDQNEGTTDVMTNVNILADRGVRFTNSFVDFPICCPSRVTFLTGQHSQNHGIEDNGPPDGGYIEFQNSGAEDNTLPVWLKDAGYKTAFVGKYVNGYGFDAAVPPGWDWWFGLTKLGYYNYTVSDNGKVISYGNSTSEYLTDVLSNKAVEFISEQPPTQPFFLWVAPYAPHNDPSASGFTIPAPRHAGKFSSKPLPKPPSFNEADVSDKPSFLRDPTNPLMDAATIRNIEQNHQKRLETLLALDDMVGNITSVLESSGKLENTIIIYTSDNGWFSGEHRLPAGKELMYEEAIRVPLILSGPGAPNGEQRNQLVQNIDLAPTIVDIANAVPGRAMDGRSVMPLLQDDFYLWRTTLLFQSANWQGSYKTAKLKGIRTDRFSYAEYAPTFTPVAIDALSEVQELKRPQPSSPSISSALSGEYEFYDLRIDPYQLTNRINDPAYAAGVSDLRLRLGVLKNCSGSDCWSMKPDTDLLTPPYAAFPPNQLPDGALAQPTLITQIWENLNRISELFGELMR